MNDYYNEETNTRQINLLHNEVRNQGNLFPTLPICKVWVHT